MTETEFWAITQADRQASDLLRDMARDARYPWVYRKLHSARMHILSHATVAVIDTPVTFGDLAAIYSW